MAKVDYSHLMGKKFNRLTLICEDGIYTKPSGQRERTFKFQCDCGNIITKPIRWVLSGNTKSCGCFRKEYVANKNQTHGKSRHPLYVVYCGIKQRCLDAKSRNAYAYHDRGITVCNEWRNSFDAFYNWAISNGWQPGLQIDRIDNNGNYCPENCRVTTYFENSLNKSNTLYINYNGQKVPLKKVCIELGLKYDAIHNRIKTLGWDVERALTTPVISYR